MTIRRRRPHRRHRPHRRLMRAKRWLPPRRTTLRKQTPMRPRSRSLTLTPRQTRRLTAKRTRRQTVGRQPRAGGPREERGQVSRLYGDTLPERDVPLDRPRLLRSFRVVPGGVWILGTIDHDRVVARGSLPPAHRVGVARPEVLGSNGLRWEDTFPSTTSKRSLSARTAPFHVARAMLKGSVAAVTRFPAQQRTGYGTNRTPSLPGGLDDWREGRRWVFARDRWSGPR